jgi:hypothetical protein
VRSLFVGQKIQVIVDADCLMHRGAEVLDRHP